MTIPPINVHTNDRQFVACLPKILELEGGNDDDPHDPGGRTSRGVTQREYDVYRKRKHLPVKDVWTADWNEIFDIYYEGYWLPWSPQLWPGLDQMYFDQAVNQGPVQAARNLQRAINDSHDPGWTAAALRAVGLRSAAVAVDGHLGPATLYAVSSVTSRLEFLKTYYHWDMTYYRRLRNWYYYGRGWAARAAAVYRRALEIFDATKGG